MIIIKLIVLICCINDFSASPTDCCEICVNHTLCKYKTQGPSLTCKAYDSSALLTRQDITELVNKINERRNFVAMGYSKILPQAADMKIIHWSTELSTFAQRWVDQCDPSVHPDKEDQCRDLENVKVGQNIASVMGSSPGLTVKGFVEMWFMQVLDYAGSVTYYNESRDYKTNHFTQLIWADTEFVGCGKAKFYVDERNLMLERLICNFAPTGNTHGKPVYSIGYPGTQCKNKMMPDDKYKGLCGYEDYGIFTELTTQKRPVNSLLRILNLSNDLVKHEIDPIRNNLKQTNVNSNSSNEQRNQKTRHIFSNKTYAAVKRIPQLRKQFNGKSVMNISGHDNGYHHQYNRGHSHLYHGYEAPRYNYEITTVLNTNPDYRRYDFTTEPINSYSNNNYRKFNQYAQCTRKMRPMQNSCESNQCTRGLEDCCQLTTICPSTCTEIPATNPVEDRTCPSGYIPPLPEPCPCTKQTCPPISTNCNYDTNCQSSIPCSTQCHTTICPGILRPNNDFNDYRRTGTFQYYDIISYPNVVVRSGNHKISQESSSRKGLSFFDNSDINTSYKTLYEEKDPDQIHKSEPDHPKYKLQDRDYLYHSFDSSLRKKRQLEDQITFKPFWQIENFNYKKPTHLRSMKYTTLANKKNRKTRRSTEPGKWLTSTEPITLKLADYAEEQPEHVTEKYLSFDELMHLRKISDGYAHYDLRRKGKTTAKGATKPAPKKTTKPATKPAAEGKEVLPDDKETSKATGKSTKKPAPKTTKAAGNTTKTQTTTIATTVSKTTEYTANTPFERKKHCTRRLTCTWTAYTSNEAEDHKFMLPGIESGSRTPPGYVEGCTRTSTCTRDYMDRNKISTVLDDSSSESTTEDEDYCERRSLNVQRRNSDGKTPIALLLRYLEYTDYSKTTTHVSTELIFNTNTDSVTKTVSKTHGCICNTRYARNKRQGTEYSRDNEDQCHKSKSSFSYGDLYYLILNKILKSHQANKLYTNQCPCNSSIRSSPIVFLFLIIFLLHSNELFRLINNNVFFL